MSGFTPVGGGSSLPETIHVDDALDSCAFTPVHGFIVLLIAVVIVLDGFDSQLLGFAVPVMMQDWALPRDAFTFAVTASFVGMVAGSLISGLLADKVGRRRMILLTLSVCALATCLVGTASSVTEVAFYRFFAGIGIGGVLPVCTTLSAEFTPLRYRVMVVTASIVCVPVGGVLAGFFSNYVLYSMGWRFAFYSGGGLTMILLAVLWFKLPESPRFLAGHSKQWGELRGLLAKLGLPVADKTTFMDGDRQSGEPNRRGFTALLQGGLARDSFFIGISFFFCMLAVYSVFGWLPTILVASGISAAAAGHGLTAYNLGGVVGSVICAWSVSRYGSRAPLAVCATGGAVSIFALLMFDLESNVVYMLILLTCHGFFVNAVQSPLYALANHVYPTSIRATGTAMAAACGRTGAICAGLSGGLISGAAGYFALLGISMLVVVLALACIRRHIPSSKRAGSQLPHFIAGDI